MHNTDTMYNTHKQPYVPPRVKGEASLLLESDLLFGSVVNSLNSGGIFTTPLPIEERDFDTDDFNFKWE